MKHYDVDVKKFIKNVVSLVVSALLLIAATIAWFAQSDHASMGAISASVKSQVQFDYAHASFGSTSADFLDTVSGNLMIRNRAGQSETSTALGTYVTGNGLTWVSDEEDDNWNLDLYPGEYGVYKITYTTDSSARDLTISLSNIPTDTAARGAITVAAYAYSVESVAGGPSVTVQRTLLDSTETTLGALVGSGSSPFTVLSGITANSGVQIEVYYVIGMSATDGSASSYQHDETLMQTGTSITIDEIAVALPAGSSS